MSKPAIDSSSVVALLSPWHTSHETVFARFQAHGPAELILPSHALIESYAVLTRLPPPYRISPAKAVEGLTLALRSKVKVVGLGPSEHWGLIEELSSAGIAGGLSYDAVILASALRAGATEFWTLNAAHFSRVALGKLDVVDLLD